MEKIMVILLKKNQKKLLKKTLVSLLIWRPIDLLPIFIVPIDVMGFHGLIPSIIPSSMALPWIHSACGTGSDNVIAHWA